MSSPPPSRFERLRRGQWSPLADRQVSITRLRRQLAESERLNQELQATVMEQASEIEVLASDVKLYKEVTQELELERTRLNEIVKSAKKQLEALVERDSWDLFLECVRDMPDSQITPAIEELEELLEGLIVRRKTRDEGLPQRRRKAEVAKSGSQSASPSHSFVNTPSTYTPLIDDAHHREYVTSPHTPTRLHSPVARSTTSRVGHHGGGLRKQVRPRRSLQRLRKAKSFQNLADAGAKLGAKILGFFGVSPKKTVDKGKGRLVQPVIEEQEFDYGQPQTPHKVMPGESRASSRRQTRKLAANTDPYGVRNPHPNVASSPIKPTIQLDGQNLSQLSLECESGLTKASKQRHISLGDRKGFTTSMDWPEGSKFREYEEAIVNESRAAAAKDKKRVVSSPVPDLRRTDQYQLSQGESLKFNHPKPSPSDQRRSLPQDMRKYQHRKTTVTQMMYGPPQHPPPNRPLPAIPTSPRGPRPKSSQIEAVIRRKSALRNVVGVDDDDAAQVQPSAARSPSPSFASAARGYRNSTPARVDTRRLSSPMPTPSTGGFPTFRPDSPSPGGNGDLGEIGGLKWQQEP